METVVAAARRRPVPPLPDTKVSLDAFLKGLVIVSAARLDDKFASVAQEEDEMRESDRKICSASMLHQADVAVRCAHQEISFSNYFL